LTPRHSRIGDSTPEPPAETLATAAKRRGAALSKLSDRDRNYLAALEDERAGYLTRGFRARAREVDEEIARLLAQ
jgi:hypothetical protein